MMMRRLFAFTYIELLAVIIVVALLAGLAMPKLESLKVGREEREFKTALRDIAGFSRTRSIESGDLVGLTFDKGKSEIEVTEQSADGLQKQVRSLPVPSFVAPFQFRQGTTNTQSDAGPADWSIAFFPDGTSVGGGAEFVSADRHFSFVIRPTDATGTVLDGTLPDTHLDRWPAGSYAKRA